MKPVHGWANLSDVDGQIMTDDFDQYYIYEFHDSCEDNCDISEPVTILPGHIDFKRVEEIKALQDNYCHNGEYPIRELIQMLTGDK